MTSAFSIDPRPLGLHLRPVTEHWREPSSSKGLGIAEAVVADISKGTDMNQHVHPEQVNAAYYVRLQPPNVAYYARELYEAAIAADADWDSNRAPYRQKRLQEAWDAMQRVMGE